MLKHNRMSYVTTQSGPIVPAREKPIEVMKNIIATMQGKYKKGDPSTDWSDLAKQFNSDVKSKRPTIREIVKKALTEAVADSRGESIFRLDLGNIVMDAAHAKFLLTRKNHKVMTELLYPNDNGNITLRFNVENMAMKMYEVSLDSEYYLNNFGNTILLCCDDCIKEVAKIPAEEDLYGNEGDFAPMMSSDMRALNDLCALVEGQFTETDVNQPQDGQAEDAAPEEMPQAMTSTGTSTDPTSSIPDSTEGDDSEGETFREFANGFKTNSQDHPEYDCINRINASKDAIAENTSVTGIHSTASEHYHNRPGTILDNSQESLNKFLKYYPKLDEGLIPIAVLDAIGEWLADYKGDTRAAPDFEEWARSQSETVAPYVLNEPASPDNGENMDDVDLQFDSDPYSMDNNSMSGSADTMDTGMTEDNTDYSMGGMVDTANNMANQNDNQTDNQNDNQQSFDFEPPTDDFNDASGVSSIAEDSNDELNLGQ